ncbi:hypothetical protein [Clostridium novyi]|nr:hypothetical protein [Clostridium novyi]
MKLINEIITIIAVMFFIPISIWFNKKSNQDYEKPKYFFCR